MDEWPANCDNKAYSAQLKLELGLSLAKNENVEIAIVRNGDLSA